jgi:SAM-dependent methyltransferase
MRATQKVENALRGLLQRYGTEPIKRRLWNRQYAQGRWKCLDTMATDCVYPHLEGHARNGSILDLGCGPGAVRNELKAEAYCTYTGVDICDLAVEKARSRTVANRRADKNVYFQSDIFSYVPQQQYDVIFFGDSIYYFPHQQIAEMLERYSNYLKPNGVFIVRSWLLKDRHRTIIHNIESAFDVVEKRLYHNAALCVIVFGPPATQRRHLTRTS